FENMFVLAGEAGVASPVVPTSVLTPSPFPAESFWSGFFDHTRTVEVLQVTSRDGIRKLTLK
ncbi:hypothetical protein NOU13_10655, partial [Rhodococcus erythropolis]|uniref:hypothetical protein n=1 Tax=Rhodococcus erythropolis TaxID=1833 RepID=UPI00210CCFC5